MVQASVPTSVLITAGREVLFTKFCFVAMFTLVAYDHLITIADEVELIWKRKFTAATWLFIINRYYSLIVLWIAVFEDISPLVDDKTCSRMILFQPLVASVPMTIVPGLVISLRIFALYGRNKYLLVALFVYLLAELAVALWIYLTPSVVRLDLFSELGHSEISKLYSMHSCMAAVSPSLSNLEIASFQIMESIYNSIALGLILYKTANGKGVLKVIAKQGLLYYIINFTSVMVWTMMLLFATSGLKYTFAGPALGFASMSTNKLTLHLRRYGSPKSGVEELKIDENVSYRLERRHSWIGMSTFEMSDSDLGVESSRVLTPTNQLTTKDVPQLVRATIVFGPDARRGKR